MSVEHGELLPRSGIGVDGTRLIIAPPGNPLISLDARLLDRIELTSRSPRFQYFSSTLAAGGAVAGLFSLLPLGVVGTLGLAYLARERFSAGRERAQNCDLLLVLGTLEIALHVADGPEAAKWVAESLSQYTRTAPITRAEVYQDAVKRMHEQVARRSGGKAEAPGGLKVGADIVQVTHGQLQIGSTWFRVEDVRSHALRGDNLPLPGGRLLQAALGLLVIAADERSRNGEDLDALAKRIATYEEWSGRNAIR